MVPTAVCPASGVLTVAHELVVALVLHSAYVWFDAACFGALPALWSAGSG